MTVAPPRRTVDRGLDPDDPTYSVTVVLPDVSLCEGHAFDVGTGTTLIGWCDDEHCRMYGEVGEKSPCGRRYEKLAPRKR